MAASVASEVKRALGFPDVKPTRSLALGSEDLLSLSILEAADFFELPRNELPPDVRSPSFVQSGRYLATEWTRRTGRGGRYGLARRGFNEACFFEMSVFVPVRFEPCRSATHELKPGFDDWITTELLLAIGGINWNLLDPPIMKSPSETPKLRPAA
jgi:hypothetical protein